MHVWANSTGRKGPGPNHFRCSDMQWGKTKQMHRQQSEQREPGLNIREDVCNTVEEYPCEVV